MGEVRRHALIPCLVLLSWMVAGKAQYHAEVKPLRASVFVHLTYKDLGGYVFPTNGLLVETDSTVVMIDAGWVAGQTVEILHWVRDSIGKPVTDCIVTHFHDDRTAGIPVLQAAGVKVWGASKTAELCEKMNEPVPDMRFEPDTTMVFDGLEVEAVFPGAGHSEDNIVIWLPQQKILFGGCLIKSCEAQGIGYTGDADMEHWDDAIRVLQKRFPDAGFVVPGHQGWDCERPLERTLELLNGPDPENN